MRLYNLPNSAGMTDRERTFFGLSMYSNGIFDYKLSDNTDPPDDGDIENTNISNGNPRLRILMAMKKYMHRLGVN